MKSIRCLSQEFLFLSHQHQIFGLKKNRPFSTQIKWFKIQVFLYI